MTGHILFVYGTLLTGFGNWSYYLAPQEGTPNTLAGYTMYSLGGFPAIIETGNPDDVVRGEVFQVDSQRLRKIDFLEGYREEGSNGNHYNRVEVELLGSGIRAFTYVYAHPESLDSRPAVAEGDWRRYVNPEYDRIVHTQAMEGRGPKEFV
jgi:gamma-glutamylcyclotransferase (GGCT)/AIG2-like uncharacterized protein YtfP